PLHEAVTKQDRHSTAKAGGKPCGRPGSQARSHRHSPLRDGLAGAKRPRPSRLVRPSAGCWVLGAGCWVLGAGCWVLGAGCRVLRAAPSTGLQDSSSRGHSQVSDSTAQWASCRRRSS
ncbi:MAG: hypothetical protein E6Q92_12430, partial [Burkholderiaceae bacterium]